MGQAEVDAANDAFVQGFKQGDAAAVAAVYEPDGRLLPPNTEAQQGSAAIEAFWKGVIDAGVRGVLLETDTLDERDDLAVEVGRYTLRTAPDGAGDVVDVGKYVVMHRRQPDGSWRYAVDIFNSNRPPA
jgi:uncharacterized protein (TIGR02246 family)